MSRVEKQVVLITGCSSGIGKQLAKVFHQNGYIVYQTARRIGSLEGGSKDLRNLQIDVTKPKEIEDAVYKIINEAGKIDILINNAGYSYFGPLVEVPVDEMKKMYDVNIHGILRMIHAVTPHMIEQENGLILNISSISSVVHSLFAAPYCSSKAAVYAISNILRQELRLFGISVVEVQPGAIRSKFTENAQKRIEGVQYKYFSKYRDAVSRRVAISQVNAMEAHVFAEKLMNRVKVSGKRFDQLNPLIRIGPMSRKLPFFVKFLPTSIVDRMAYKKIGIKGVRMPSLVGCKCIFVMIVFMIFVFLMFKFLFL